MLRGVRPPSCVLGSAPNSTLKLLSCVVSSPFPFALFFPDQREREKGWKRAKRWPTVCLPKCDIAARLCESSWCIAPYPLQIAPRFSEKNVCRERVLQKIYYFILNLNWCEHEHWRLCGQSTPKARMNYLIAGKYKFTLQSNAPATSTNQTMRTWLITKFYGTVPTMVYGADKIIHENFTETLGKVRTCQ